ncbi:glycosyltransferase family 4 protein [Nocardiopsis lambiniae]|uniref:Glycosyltransferase family 4 protein n=1 Tax=Nocardiopsis lambiniae TaxID=3075539 RepID=A0ABU2MBR2_9ACTN|nr:glycosyltransferase family 4 protein [Nocardiopsis sp. DSM 44743]MDT0330123.1 glycosyltransferase family 4 protein [Nocardiopsis sp. DSM 44743]
MFAVPPALAPSGGHTYDRRLARALPRLRPVTVAGSWPRPDATARTALDEVLASAPDGETVLLDGLVACGVPEVVLPHATRLRIVVLVHLPLADETGTDPAQAADLETRERSVLRGAAAVIATSRTAARDLAARHDLPGVRAVPPGVDPAPATVPGDGSRLLCVASPTPRKGHDVLFSALDRVSDLPWTCVCVGPTPDDSDAWAERIRAGAQRFAGRVTLPGALVGDDLAAAYAAADLLTLPSRAETYGMVVTEALARAVPVLASEVGGIPEALGRDRAGRPPGLLVPPQDPEALATGLRRWLTEPDLRDRLRSSARLRRTDLTGWAEVARGVAAVLDPEEFR